MKFCLLAIGWELLSVGNLFCWFQMVASEYWQELQVLFWVGMYLGRKKKTIAAFLKTQL